MKLHRAALQDIKLVAPVALLYDDVLRIKVDKLESSQHLLLLRRPTSLEQGIRGHRRVQHFFDGQRLLRRLHVHRGLPPVVLDELRGQRSQVHQLVPHLQFIVKIFRVAPCLRVLYLEGGCDFLFVLARERRASAHGAAREPASGAA